MKRNLYFTIALLLLNAVLSAQDYQLFNLNVKKLFTTFPIPSQTYSLAFDSVAAGADSLVFYNFFTIENEMTASDSCFFWGSENYCYHQSIPEWMGGKIIYSNPFFYSFFNLNAELLTFNFGINPGDTALFYSGNQQNFQITNLGNDTVNIFGETDSAMFFRIVHTDFGGNVVNSAINNHEIIIGKNLGLLQWFQVDSFPQVLKPLQLQGQNNPAMGFSNLTNEMIYSYQPGDEYQVHEYSNYWMSVPPEWEWERYRYYRCISRNMTPDSLIYQFHRKTIVVDSSLEFVDTVRLSYFRQEIISEIPFDRFDGRFRQFFLQDFVGLKMWTYSVNTTQGWEFCPEDNCWSFGDTFGPPIEWEKEYVCGLGAFLDKEFIISPQGYTKSNHVVYFRKNGFTWGELVVGLTEQEKVDEEVFVAPNPAKDNLSIKTVIPFKGVSVHDICGSLHLSQPSAGKECLIDITSLKPGIYFVSVILENNFIVTKKVFVEN